MPSVKQIEIDGVTYDLGGACGFSDDAKNALIALLENVAYIGTDGQQYLTDLYNKMFDNYWSITNTLSNASNSNSAQTVEKGSSYSATISASVGYTLTGATVSITMNGADVTSSVYNNGTILIPTVTGDVVITVVAVALTLVSISAVYTQSGTVYNTDSLDSLKSDLVVTATFNDSSVSVIPSSDYTLSGTLAVGTSTITVTYGEFTDTFSVTVTNIIPSDYTEVEYLLCSVSATSQNSYVDTGISFDNPSSAKMIVEYAETSGYDQYQYIIGTRKTNTGNTNDLGWGIRIVNDHVTVGSWSNSPGAVATITAYSRHKYTATWAASELTIQVDDETPVSAAQATRGITGYPICIGGVKNVGSGGNPYPAHGYIYYAECEADGVTLFKMLPCKRNSDSKPGFYNVVDGSFCAATGSYITAGPEV